MWNAKCEPMWTYCMYAITKVHCMKGGYTAAQYCRFPLSLIDLLLHTLYRSDRTVSDCLSLHPAAVPQSDRILTWSELKWFSPVFKLLPPSRVITLLMHLFSMKCQLTRVQSLWNSLLATLSDWSLNIHCFIIVLPVYHFCNKDLICRSIIYLLYVDVLTWWVLLTRFHVKRLQSPKINNRIKGRDCW